MLKSKFSLHHSNQEILEEETVKKKDKDVKKKPSIKDSSPSVSDEENKVGEEASVVQEEEEILEYFEERALNKSEISVRLSWLGKTADGECYAYLKATCTGMSLTTIVAIKCFKHLQFVNVSNNFLNLEALQAVTELPFLLLLHADRNKCSSANLNKCKYLQVIIMNNNMLKTVEDVFQPELSTFEVGYNSIQEIKFINRMPTLKVLDFRYNLLRHVNDMNFPNLDSLYLAGNKIKDLSGINSLANLRVLHLRNNPIRLLNGFVEDHPRLTYLNLRSCKVATLIQIKKLRTQTALETLIIKNTPYMGGTGKEDPEVPEEEEDPELRVEVLAALPRLKRLNKTPFTPEEIQEAKEMMALWLEEGEKDEEEQVAEEGAEEEEHEED